MSKAIEERGFVPRLKPEMMMAAYCAYRSSSRRKDKSGTTNGISETALGTKWIADTPDRR